MSAIAWVMNIVRIALFVLILVTILPTIQGLMEKKIGWDQAVDSLFSNWIITLMLAILVLSLLVSIFRNPIARVIVTVSLAAAVVCLVTGTVTMDSVRESVTAYNLAGTVKDTVEKCNLELTVENFGGKFRAVVKDPDDTTKVVGYVNDVTDGMISILDPAGSKICPDTAAPEDAAKS
jgi:hypothetical protein